MTTLFHGLTTTIFETMSRLAEECGAVNLGQGFPEQDGARPLRELAAGALLERSNQYPPARGLLSLREALAEHYARSQGIHLDPRNEVLITSGATEALAATFLAHLADGDEVVAFGPLYDAYAPLVARAGGRLRTVLLRGPDFSLTEEALLEGLRPTTKVVIVNTPNNPTGAVYGSEVWARLGKHAEDYGTLIVSDEVWEHVTFPGKEHVSCLSDRRLRDRAIKIGSVGKMFGLTGWKVGIVCAVPELLEPVMKAHQFLTFTTPPHLQHAVADYLPNSASHFVEMERELGRSKTLLREALEREGYAVVPGDGTYFLSLDLSASGLVLTDEEFSLRAVREARVATIPFSAFYPEARTTSFVRLCFAKGDETLLVAARRLGDFRRALLGL